MVRIDIGLRGKKEGKRSNQKEKSKASVKQRTCPRGNPYSGGSKVRPITLQKKKKKMGGGATGPPKEDVESRGGSALGRTVLPSCVQGKALEGKGEQGEKRSFQGGRKERKSRAQGLGI